MATNEPIPINFYTRNETDLKLENMEQRINARMDQGFERILTEFKLLRQELKQDNELLRQEFKGDLALVRQELMTVRWFTGGMFLLWAAWVLSIVAKYFHWL